MLSFDIAGKHAVITGGGGIGGATAMAMAELGAHVTVADRVIATARDVVDTITRAGGSADAQELDVADVAAVRRFFAGLDTPPDILVATAGVIKYTNFLEQDAESFEQLVNVNLRGTFFCVQEAARRMVENGGGSIVTLSSVAAFVATRQPATAYAMTKAGVRQLTTASSVELAPLGVRVNAVAPATIDTAFLGGSLDDPAARAAAVARSPIGRIGVPSDVVGAIVFLASPLAEFITGHTLVIDGGRLGRAG